MALRLDHGLASGGRPVACAAELGRLVGLALAVTRTSIGAVTFVAPSLARLWVGPTGCTDGGKVLSRSLAARDIALGAGALLAANRPKRLRTWVALAALGDLTDALGTMTGGVPSRPRALVTVASLGAVAAGAVAVAKLSAAD